MPASLTGRPAAPLISASRMAASRRSRRGIAADAAQTYDADGRPVCAGLIETHIHLDKSRIIDRCAPQDGRRVSPVSGRAAQAEE